MPGTGMWKLNDFNILMKYSLIFLKYLNKMIFSFLISKYFYKNATIIKECQVVEQGLQIFYK